VPVGDMEVFGNRLLTLSADRERLLRFKKAAWETSCKYSVERTTADYVAVLREADASLAGAARAPRPPGAFPIMPSCRSSYPPWLRRLKWRAVGAGRGLVMARSARRLTAAAPRRRS